MYLIIILFLIIGIFSFVEYWNNHLYYIGMLTNLTNIKLILFNFIVSLFIFLIIRNTKKIYILWFAIFLGIYLYGLFSYIILGSFIIEGLFLWLINVLFFGLISFLFFVILNSIGWLIFKQNNFFDFFMRFGFGLLIFLIYNYILIIFNFHNKFFVWLFILIGFIFTYYFKDNLKNDLQINLNFDKISSILFIITLMYLNHGFIQAYIPYPTAWDANHAYMFFPKIWASNGGYYWGEQSLFTSLSLWLGYITFWFNLLPEFWIASDTIAIVMNMFSGIISLVLFLALLKELMKVFSFDDKNIFYIGWFLFLLWLTSGMGAFLIFVDNKIDLGLLILIILGLYVGFYAYLNIDKKDYLKYIILSGIYFASAVLAKPTALFDIIMFFGLLSSLYLHWSLSLSIFFFILFLVVYIQYGQIIYFFPKDFSYNFLYLSIIFFVIFIYYLYKNKIFKKLISIFIWGFSFIIFLILFKSLFWGVALLYGNKVNLLNFFLF